jgi:hypothetical protein
MALLHFNGFERSIARARRAWVELALVAGLFAIIGAVSYAFVSAHHAAEHEHSMKCLAAYMTMKQVIGGPEAEALEKLESCEHSPVGKEQIHLDAREHPLVVERYEACLAAHQLMAADLDKSLAEQRRFCQ